MTAYVGSGFSASTSSPRNGSYCAHLVAPANTASRATFVVTHTKGVQRFGVKVSSRPSSGTVILWHCTDATAGVPFSIQISSAGVLSAQVAGGTAQTGPTIDTSNWHLIEVQFDSTAKTLDWKVDGGAQTQATSAGTVSPPNTMALGTPSTSQPAFTADYDDWILGTWTTAATDWYGNGKVLAQLAGVDGTHATITSLSPGDAGTAYSGTPTNVNTMVDDPAGTGGWTATRSTTDNIALRTATVGAYAEIKPATTAETGSANAVRAIMSYSSSTTAGNLAACDARNSAGTVTALFGTTGGTGANYSVTANNFAGALVTVPAAGWTASEVNAVRFRFGGCTSVDVVPIPTVQAMMLEVDWPVPATALTRTASDSWSISDGGLPAPTDYVLCWPFEDGTGTTVADVSGNVRTGTGSGVTWVTGKVGTWALQLAGSANSDGVKLPSSLGVGTVYSVAAWLKFNDNTDGVAIGDETGVYQLYYDATSVYFSSDSGNFVSQAHGLTLPDANWHHYAATRNGFSVQFYLDGVALGSVKTLASNTTSSFSKVGGYATSVPAFPAAITIDDFRLYTRVLSAVEVATIKTPGTSGLARTLGLVRPAADSWSISDAAVGVPSGGGGGTSYPRTASDTVTLSDAAVRSAAHPRTAVDSWTISDGGAAGAFPANTTVIDDFNRVNNAVNVGAGAAIWADWPINAASHLLNIQSNTLTGNAGEQAMTWPGLPYGPDIDVQFKVSTKGTDYLAFFFAFQPGGTGNYPSSVFSGYALTLNLGGTDIWDFRSYTGGSGGVISGSAVTQSWAAGDLIGVSMRGSTLSAYRKPSGGSWTLITQVTNTAHNVAGGVGWETGGGASHFLDDLIGGTVVSGGAIGRTVSLVRPAADTVAISDVAVRAPVARPRPAADTVAVSDVAATGGTVARTAADSVALSDAAVRAPATRTRTATDSLTVSDTAIKGGVAQRTAADSWTLSDVAVRSASARVRTAADSVSLSDTVTVILVSAPRLALTSSAHATGTLTLGLAVFVERILRPDADLAISGWTGTFADVNDQSDLTVVTAVIA